MRTQTSAVRALEIAASFALACLLSQQSSAQTLLDQTGTSILGPSLAPTGGYAQNPQEYLTISWSVIENNSGVYTYSYTLNNPTGDVLLNPNGSLTATPESVDYFSVSFNTTAPGAYMDGSQSGSPFESADSVDLAWFLNPSIAAGGSSATLSYESDLPPASGYGDAAGGGPPAPWSTISSPTGPALPVPDVTSVPEPEISTLLGAAGGFGFLFRFAFRARGAVNQ